MAKAHQDQSNWPYAPSHFFPQHPRRYNLPYAHTIRGRFCQESCCRRSRAPLPYPHPLPPLPPSLPCRPPQDNSYSRPQPSSQSRGFLPVNPYVQQHPGAPHPQQAVHRPIPQGRYEYNEFYRYQPNANNNNNHQGFHAAVLKQNANTYGVPNPSHASEQYPACSHYTPIEQESAPSLDVRQFLATWQDKDEESFETEQQQKPKVQYLEPAQSSEVFKPLDCTKRNENPLPMYGYNPNQMNPHSAYYNKNLQSIPNHQLISESYKNASYMSGNSYHPMPVENECNYSSTIVDSSPHAIIDNDPQHVGYERRIEKVFNPHSCKVIPAVPTNEPNLCAVDKVNQNLEMKAPPALQEKNQYHLSASLESEDLFDDINRKKEERQRNIVHPLCYQEMDSQQRMSSNIRNKIDIPQISVKPNTATHMNYPMDSFAPHNVSIDYDMDLKKPKALPIKKWVQKRKKSEEEFFPSFSVSDQTLDFSTRDTVIERSHIHPPCVPDMVMGVNDGDSCSPNIADGISHVNDGGSMLHEVSAANFNPTINSNSEKPSICVFEPVSLMHPQVSHSNDIQELISCPSVALDKTNVESAPPMSLGSDEIDISIVPHCPSHSATSIEQPKDAPIPIKHDDILKSSSREEQSEAKDQEVQDSRNTDASDGSYHIDNVTADAALCAKGTTETTMGDQWNTSPINRDELLPCVSKGSPASTNALKTIAYLYDNMNDANNVSDGCLDSTHSALKANRPPYSRRRKSAVRFPQLKKNRDFNLLTLWRYRNRLFPKSLTLKPWILEPQFRVFCKKTRCLREFSKFFFVKKRRYSQNKIVHSKSCSRPNTKIEESEVVKSVVLSSLVEDVCQIGEVTSQLGELSEEMSSLSSTYNLSTEIENFASCTSEATGKNEQKSDEVGWEMAARDENVSSTVESDVSEDDNSNVINEEYVGNAGSSIIEGPDDRVLDGILNWPHHEEEITSINENESIKVSLPWGKIFKPHCELPDGEKTLEIGPARVELRYSPAPVEYQPGHYQPSRNSFKKKSFSVKKVLLKHNIGSQTERLPKMVIKKTGCEEYKSYIKDAKLRVVSIKNSNKDGQAEVIIEADRPLIDSPTNCQENLESDSPVLRTSGVLECSESSSELSNSDCTSQEEKELHHCLLCQESFTDLEKLRNHENSLSHRHIDIVQRSVLHKLQKSFKGIDFPPFQPLTQTELEYLNWRPNFPGYNHFYHNIPL